MILYLHHIDSQPTNSKSLDHESGIGSLARPVVAVMCTIALTSRGVRHGR